MYKSKNENKGSRPEKKAPKKISERYLYNAGMAYLQRFPASTHHFKTVMMRKIDRSCRFHEDQERGICAKMLEETAKKFQTLGLLDDGAYLRGMVTSLRRRGLSSRGIAAKLQQKGFPASDVMQAVKTYDVEEHQDEAEEEGEMKAALILARKKRIGPFRRAEKEPDLKKEMASLARAGYPYDIVKKIIQSEVEF